MHTSHKLLHHYLWLTCIVKSFLPLAMFNSFSLSNHFRFMLLCSKEESMPIIPLHTLKEKIQAQGSKAMTLARKQLCRKRLSNHATGTNSPPFSGRRNNRCLVRWRQIECRFCRSFSEWKGQIRGRSIRPCSISSDISVPCNYEII